MSNISWAGPTNGTWTNAADWTGGVVPSTADTATIETSGSSPYGILSAGAVSVAGLVLDDRQATLDISGSFAAAAATLSAGTLLLDGGSLSGTFATAGAATQLSTAGGTLNGVTWIGSLNLAVAAKTKPLLTITNSLTLLGANGTGPGAASFNSQTNLDGVASLDNAAIGVGGDHSYLQSYGTPTLTLGSHLSLIADIEFGSKVAGSAATSTLVNNGTLTGSINYYDTRQPGTGTLINNGMINGVGVLNLTAFTNNGTVTNGRYLTIFGEETKSFTNNGSIAENGVLFIEAAALKKAGAGAAITLGTHSALVFEGTLTTAKLLAVRPSQHVTFAGPGDAIEMTGTVINTGAVLDIGKGTTLGEFAGGYQNYVTVSPIINGGTVIDHDTATHTRYGLTLNSVAYQSTSPTLQLASTTMNASTLTGVSTLDFDGGNSVVDGGTLSGVGTLIINADLTLNDVDITGNNGAPTIDVVAGLTIGAAQNLSGYTIDCAIPGSEPTLTFADASTIAGAVFNIASQGRINQPTKFINTGSAGETFAASTSINIAAQTVLLMESAGDATSAVALAGTISSAGTLGFIGLSSNDVGTAFVNSGVIDITQGGALEMDPAYITGQTSILSNTGTIAVTQGVLELDLSRFSNTGSVSVTNGTLALAGDFSVAGLSEISHPGSLEVVEGTLTLSGSTLTLGSPQLPVFEITDGTLTDGTLRIGAQTTLSVAGDEYSTTLLDAAILNNGIIAVQNSVAGGSQGFVVAVDQAISGSGTIQLVGPSQANGNNAAILQVESSVAAPQTIQMENAAAQLRFTASAETSFAGKIGGFAQYDAITLVGTVTQAGFHGASIVATLSTGATIALATTSALTGSLTISESSLNNAYASVLTYSSTGSSVAHDFAGGVLPAAIATPQASETAQTARVSHWSADPGSWFHGIPTHPV